MIGKRSWGIFLILLIVSILLHGFAWKWLELRDWQQPKHVNKSAATTTQVVLQYLPPPQKVLIPEKLIPEEPALEKHAPIHNAEDFASSNNSDKSVKKITPGKQPNIKDNLITKELQPKYPQSKTVQLKSKKIEAFHKNEFQKIEKSSTSENSKSVISSIESTQSMILKESLPIAQNEYFEQVLSGGSLSTELNYQDTKPAIPDEVLVVLGDMELLDDYHLGAIEVKEPFSEIEAKRIRMVNRYLERMEKQIHDEWVRPEISNKQLSGVIKFSLSPSGYLHDVYIYLGSGDSALDHSALEAVKRVKRFSVPESTLLAAKYYSNLRFQYSSQDFVGESIPRF